MGGGWGKESEAWVVVLYGMVWYGMVWYGMYGMVWYGVVSVALSANLFPVPRIMVQLGTSD